MTNEPKTTAERDYPPLPEPAYFAGPRPYVLAEHAYVADQMHAYYDLGREAGAREAVGIPAGWKLVPLEPTPEMLAVKDENGYPILSDDEYYFDSLASAHRFGASLYRAMLTASPTAQAAPAAGAVPGDAQWALATAEAEERAQAHFSAGVPQPPAEAQEPLQVFDSPRAKALMRAWEEGWEACRDAEYVGEEAQNDAFNLSITLSHCIAEDQLHPAPQQAVPDMDGEAFRTAARLGLTLRFHGGCAQSGMPGAPAAYEVVASSDPADAMRQAVQQAATVIASGGEPQQLRAAAELAVPTSEQAGAPLLGRRLLKSSAATILKAMSQNYSPTHAWDKLDADACARGAAEIEELHALLATPASGGAAPVAEGDANWQQLRSALAMAMLGWSSRPDADRTMDTCYSVLDAVTEPGMPLALLRTAPDWRDAASAQAKNGGANG